MSFVHVVFEASIGKKIHSSWIIYCYFSRYQVSLEDKHVSVLSITLVVYNIGWSVTVLTLLAAI